MANKVKVKGNKATVSESLEMEVQETEELVEKKKEGVEISGLKDITSGDNMKEVVIDDIVIKSCECGYSGEMHELHLHTNVGQVRIYSDEYKKEKRKHLEEKDWPEIHYRGHRKMMFCPVCRRLYIGEVVNLGK